MFDIAIFQFIEEIIGIDWDIEKGFVQQARDQLPPTYFFDYILISGQEDDQSRPDNGQVMEYWENNAIGQPACGL